MQNKQAQSQYRLKQLFKNLVIVTVIFNLIILQQKVQCSFDPADLLEAKIETQLASAKQTDVVAFPDNVFAVLYPGDDEKGYFYTIQYGQILTPPTLFQEATTNTIYFIKGHNFQNDKLVISYTTNTGVVSDPNEIQLIVFNLQGIKLKEDIDMFPNPLLSHTHFYGIQFNEIQNDSDSLKFCLQTIPKSVYWDIKCSTYHYSTHTIDAYQEIETEVTDGRQRINALVKIDTNRNIMVYKGLGNPTPVHNDGALYFAEFDDNLNMIDSKFQYIYGTQDYHYGVTVATKNNGFAILTIEGDGVDNADGSQDSEKPYIISYDSEKKQKCFKEIPFSGKIQTMGEGGEQPLYDMITHGDYLYIIAREKTSQDIKGLVVNLDTCKISEDHPEQTITSSQSNGLVSMAKNEDQNGVTMGLVMMNTYSSVLKVDFFQYIIEQKTSCSLTNRCFGCYETTYCPACISSDSLNRINRENNSGQCGCKDGFYEDFPKQDCQSCNQYCETCESSSDNCQTCKGSDRDSSNTCACKSNYFDNGTLICQMCGNLCQECEIQSFNCTQCIKDNRMLPLCSDCIDQHSEIDGVCQKCRIGCSTCEDLETCKTCLNPNSQPPLCTQDGYLIVSDSNTNQLIFKVCDHQCKVCETSSDQCSECVGKNREQAPSCQCLSGYSDNNSLLQDCKECPVNCAQCQNSYFCLKCTSDTTHILVNGLCECRDGYFDKNKDGSCEKCGKDSFVQDNQCLPCFYYHNSCVEFCPQNTLEKGQICELEKQNQIAMIIFIILIVLFLFGFIGFLIYQNLKRQKGIDSQQQHQVIKDEEDFNKQNQLSSNLDQNMAKYLNQEASNNNDINEESNIDSIVKDI